MKDLKIKKKECIEQESSSTACPGKGSELGLIKIHENVISSIVRKAALSVDGVSRLAGSSFVDNIAEIVGSRKISDRAIAIKLDDDKVEIEIKINMKFGYKVPDVASEVQTAIIEQVENVTGMNVVGVNVVVQEIEEVAEHAEQEEENQ
ncbi:MAG: Asp23/Gls24 family envelope stress response protein [Victivallaceae bacterium]